MKLDRYDKALAYGRRGRAVILSATSLDRNTANGTPLVRLDLELTATDEPSPWRARLEHPVPLSAVPLLERGRHLVVAFFDVDAGETVAVDWPASAA